ncbi:ADP-dependent NAD(P)H-hydrate dehydratase [Aureococcus anophagefferens]|nr:ADP-dependent NAD(P)H-hydrate dehydratase [Aureococcus anophagefferens]
MRVRVAALCSASSAMTARVVPWSEGSSAVQRLVPPLSFARYKGEGGRIGVVGGSLEYTGAPYYAAASTLQVGADLSWVFCADSACTAIKSYSPELVVIPAYEAGGDAAAQMLRNVEPWARRLHGLVVGPGLGRDAPVLAGAAALLTLAARELALPVVVDADGLFLVANEPDLVRGLPNVALVPNAPEFARLRAAVCPEAPPPPPGEGGARCGGATSDGASTIAVDEASSPRRCGGLGDLLSGSLAVLWVYAHRAEGHFVHAGAPPRLWAAYGACVAARRSGAAAFAAKRRAMTAPDALAALGAAFEGMVPTVVEDA